MRKSRSIGEATRLAAAWDAAYLNRDMEAVIRLSGISRSDDSDPGEDVDRAVAWRETLRVTLWHATHPGSTSADLFAAGVATE